MIPFIVSGDYDSAQLLDSNGNQLLDSNGNTLFVRDASAGFPSSNDLGPLPDAIECFTDSELNGGYELAMRYPADGTGYKNLVNRNIILATNGDGGTRQPYRIYKITKPINGVVSVYARHIVQTDLSGVPVKPFSAQNASDAIAGINQNAMLPTGFTFSTNKLTSSAFEFNKPTPVLSLMGGADGSLLDVYGGEWKYDGKNVSLLDRIGADNGVRIVYGLNLTDFEQDNNIQSCYTGAVGYWSNDEVGTVYTPVMMADGAFDHVRIATIDLTDKFENAPSVEQLENALRSYMTVNKIGVPDVSIKLSFVDMSKTTEYEGASQPIALGDTVHIRFDKIGVNADARVMKTRWNVLLDRYENIDIGSVKMNIADTLAKQSKKVEAAATRKMVDALSNKELFVNGEKVRWS